jgi:drug/metabolite transporter (DMT)-like permease
LVLGCAFLYAFQIISISHYSSQHSLGGLSFLQVAVTAVGSSVAVPLLAASHLETFRFNMTRELIFGVLVTAVFTTALAYPLLVWGQRHTSATNTALILATEPVFAVATSFIFLHERLGVRALIGAALVLAGILMSELKGPIPASEEFHHDV